MPYIKQDDRKQLDGKINELIAQIVYYTPMENRPGALNYTICRLLTNCMKPAKGWSYHSLSKMLAVPHDAEAELRRRLMDKREDEVIIENGDLDEFK